MPKSLPISKLDVSMDRDSRAMERIATAMEIIGAALTQIATLGQKHYDTAHPVVGPKSPVTVFEARYPKPGDDERKPIENEDEVEVDSKTGKATVKPTSEFRTGRLQKSLAPPRAKK